MSANRFAAPWILPEERFKHFHSHSSLHINPTPIFKKHFVLSLSPLHSRHCGASEICHLVRAVKDNVDDLLKGVGDKSDIEEVKYFLEMARWVSTRREVLRTDFLTPPVLKQFLMALEKLVYVKAVAQGGYPQYALGMIYLSLSMDRHNFLIVQDERCQFSVGHPEVLTIDTNIVAALSITVTFRFQPCSHGDFLGSIVGTGIAREKFGDIIFQGEKGAQAIVVPELADYIISSLEKVGDFSVSCTKIPLLALEYEPPRL